MWALGEAQVTTFQGTCAVAFHAGRWWPSVSAKLDPGYPDIFFIGLLLSVSKIPRQDSCFGGTEPSWGCPPGPVFSFFPSVAGSSGGCGHAGAAGQAISLSCGWLRAEMAELGKAVAKFRSQVRILSR